MPQSVSVPPVAFANPPARSGRSRAIKLVIAVLIAVALMVPLLMIYGLPLDRQQQAETAQASIGQGWGGQQTIAGPVIVIKHEKREKAIHETVVYESQIAGSADFVLPADIARFGVAREALMLDRAEVRLGVGDARGLGKKDEVAVA